MTHVETQRQTSTDDIHFTKDKRHKEQKSRKTFPVKGQHK